MVMRRWAAASPPLVPLKPRPVPAHHVREKSLRLPTFLHLVHLEANPFQPAGCRTRSLPHMTPGSPKTIPQSRGRRPWAVLWAPSAGRRGCRPCVCYCCSQWFAACALVKNETATRSPEARHQVQNEMTTRSSEARHLHPRHYFAGAWSSAPRQG